MTSEEKTKVYELQKQGKGYRLISEELGLPLNTVKSWCTRHKVGIPNGKTGCLQCGAKISQEPHRKEKKFCSDACRLAWWNAHPEQVNRSTTKKTCAFCGRSFDAIRESNRFCSRDCFAKYRSARNEK